MYWHAAFTDAHAWQDELVIVASDLMHAWHLELFSADFIHISSPPLQVCCAALTFAWTLSIAWEKSSAPKRDRAPIPKIAAEKCREGFSVFRDGMVCVLRNLFTIIQYLFYLCKYLLYKKSLKDTRIVHDFCLQCRAVVQCDRCSFSSLL